jgi:hypothetical protein
VLLIENDWLLFTVKKKNKKWRVYTSSVATTDYKNVVIIDHKPNISVLTEIDLANKENLILCSFRIHHGGVCPWILLLVCPRLMVVMLFLL